MSKSVRLIGLLALLLLAGISVSAQGAKTKHYEKDGFSFDYPADWTLQDNSDTSKQYINVTPLGADVQIGIWAHRETAATPEAIELGRTKIVEPLVASYIKQFNQMGMKPVRKDDKSSLGGAVADAAHVRASLDGVDGEAGVYWTQLNNRLVILSLFGPDPAIKPLASQLEALRNSIAIAAPAAAPAPSK